MKSKATSTVRALWPYGWSRTTEASIANAVKFDISTRRKYGSELGKLGRKIDFRLSSRKFGSCHDGHTVLNN